MIKEDWLKVKTEHDRSVMIRRAQIARIITLCGYIVIVCTFIFVVILPYFGISLRYLTNLTDPGKVLPFQTYYIYDINKSPNFEITFILQSVSIMLAGIVYSSTDNFLGLLILHACGQLENLRRRFLLLDQNDFKDNLPYIVQDHRRIIRSLIYAYK